MLYLRIFQQPDSSDLFKGIGLVSHGGAFQLSQWEGVKPKWGIKSRGRRSKVWGHHGMFSKFCKFGSYFNSGVSCFGCFILEIWSLIFILPSIYIHLVHFLTIILLGCILFFFFFFFFFCSFQTGLFQMFFKNYFAAFVFTLLPQVGFYHTITFKNSFSKFVFMVSL